MLESQRLVVRVSASSQGEEELVGGVCSIFVDL
jgi:hypothetical protein